MKKLHLSVDKISETRDYELRMLNRSYNRVNLDSIPFHHRLYDFFKFFLSLSTLVLKKVVLYDDSLVYLLDSNGKLDKLVIGDCFKPRFRDPSTLNSLRSLSVTNSSWSILHMFPQCKNIIELKISAPSNKKVNLVNDRKHLAALMTGQEKLETLIITNYFPMDDNAVIDAKYNLKQLSVQQYGNLSCAQVKSNACLLQIMNRHKNTLENLEICVNGENFMEFIMKNLKVRRLFIAYDLLPKKFQILERIQPNLHLKKLIIDREIKNTQALQGLFRTYPRIESLIIKDWKPDVINEVLIDAAGVLKSLTFLRIPRLTIDTPNAPMPSLRTFNVDYLDEIENFLAFCLNIPSIEILFIGKLPFKPFTIGNIQIMSSRLPQLRHIIFGGEFQLKSEMLDILSSNCSKLRLIEMFHFAHSYDKNNNFQHGKIDVIYLPKNVRDRTFCNETNLWNESS